MIYVQILNGIVKNSIVLTDISLEDLFLEGFDYLIRVDTMTPQPGIDWLYDGSSFSPPIGD